MARNKRKKGIFKENLKTLKPIKNIKHLPEFASRERSIDWSGMWSWLPNPDPILKELGTDVKVYEEIETDSHLVAVIQQRKSGVTSLLWDVNQQNAPARVNKAVELIFKKLDVTRIVSEILDDFKYGYQPLEIMWARPEGGLIYPVDVVGKPPEWFTFDTNTNLRFLSADAPSEGILVPPRKFLLSQHNGRYKNPYGEALLGRVFWPVTFKKGGFKFWVAFTEKYGTPFAVGKVPRAADETEYDTLADLLSDMVQDAVAVVPDDSSIEFIQSDVKGSADTFEKLISFCNAEISKAIIGQTLTTEAGDRGARSLGEVHFDVRRDVIAEDKRRVERVFNTLIRYFVDINFGVNVEMPTFEMSEEEDVDLTLAQRDKLLSETGQVEFTQEYIDRAYSFEKGDVIVKPPEPKEAPEPAQPTGMDAFSEARFKDQNAIDTLISSLSDEDLRAQTDFVKPIFELADKVETFAEFREGLLNLFPAVRPVEVERALRNFLFAAEMFGNLTGEDV